MILSFVIGALEWQDVGLSEGGGWGLPTPSPHNVLNHGTKGDLGPEHVPGEGRGPYRSQRPKTRGTSIPLPRVWYT